MSSSVEQPFLFSHHWPGETTTRVVLPPGLSTKAALLNVLAQEFMFPDYFGENWDAFEECIRDLSWLPDGDVALEHADVPLASNARDLHTYLSILREVVEGARLSVTGRFHVTFPPEAREYIQALLGTA
jgi:RNAse (barnase) inhibitor barstar